MSIAPADIVHLWEAGGSPVRLAWRGWRYRIASALPVPSSSLHDALTHAAQRLTGWIVTAQLDDHPETVVAMRVQRAGAGWILVRVQPA